MTILQRAYSFDPARFHASLAARVVVDGRIAEARLRDIALEVVAQPTDTTQRALEDLRYDESWIMDEGADCEATDRRGFYWTRWYLCALAAALTPAPSLTERFRPGWFVLDAVLLSTGWTRDDLQQLYAGRPMHTLVEQSGIAAFAGAFPSIDQFGGWLDQLQVHTLAERLRSAERYFSPSYLPAAAAARPVARVAALDVEAVLRGAYADAASLLQAALSRRAALFLVLD
jgi:hypothetical protein